MQSGSVEPLFSSIQNEVGRVGKVKERSVIRESEIYTITSKFNMKIS